MPRLLDLVLVSMVLRSLYSSAKATIQRLALRMEEREICLRSVEMQSRQTLSRDIRSQASDGGQVASWESAISLRSQ